MCEDKEIIRMEQKDVKKSWYYLAEKAKRKKNYENILFSKKLYFIPVRALIVLMIIRAKPEEIKNKYILKFKK